MTEYDENVPPAGEDIHLPGPSVLPLLVAIAITCMVIGLTLSWWFSIFGVVLFVISAGTWIRDTRRDIDELPEEHHTH
ncbi:MAG TPA: cytochrome c oxidase subunit 4 [Solirubrobacteraceae bacterium]|jgi:type IV secretory pathway TrbD component|nr:cytochrome c oxidase subunit 4 [Solirubrobacteraceae bacterium]